MEFFERKVDKKKKISGGDWFLAVLGVLAVLLAVTAFSVWVVFMVTFKQYGSAADGIRIPYPKAWEVTILPANDVKAVFTAPKEDVLDNFQESFSFSTYDMSKEVLSTEDYARTAADQMIAVFPELTVAERSPFIVAGHQGFRTVLASAHAATVFVIYAFTMDEMGYNLMYMGDTDSYMRHKVMLDVVALAMKVKYQ